MSPQHAILLLTVVLAAPAIYGGGPKYIAGTVYFDPAVIGRPVGLITLRVRDMNGNPMAGGTVTLYQSLYAWTPPCLPRGRCAQAPLLATQSTTATSALDGTVSFVPASMGGVATRLVGVAATGDSSTLLIAIEQHP